MDTCDYKNLDGMKEEEEGGRGRGGGREEEGMSFPGDSGDFWLLKKCAAKIPSVFEALLGFRKRNIWIVVG